MGGGHIWCSVGPPPPWLPPPDPPVVRAGLARAQWLSGATPRTASIDLQRGIPPREPQTRVPSVDLQFPRAAQPRFSRVYIMLIVTLKTKSIIKNTTTPDSQPQPSILLFNPAVRTRLQTKYGLPRASWHCGWSSSCSTPCWVSWPGCLLQGLGLCFFG